MGKKNSHVHLLIETDRLNSLKLEAKKEDITANELIRRKLYTQPVPEEILLLRQLKQMMTK